MTEAMRVHTKFGEWIVMRDGVCLSADLTTPEGEGPFPTVVVRTPYGKNSKAWVDQARGFARHGYAMVVADVRGRGDSQGTFDPYVQEGPDGYDTIEWAAEQSWCSGKVGTLGNSYLARSQWLTALLRPPHLAAMIVGVTPSDPFVEWPTGVPTPHHLAWLFLTSGRMVQPSDIVDWERVYAHLPLRTMDAAAGRVMAKWQEELDHPCLDDYWKRTVYQTRYDEVDLPIMHISGWYDDEQVGTPRNFAGMSQSARTERARRSQKLIMGPWAHAINTTQKLGEVDFGPQSLIDLQAMYLRWFDYFLKGEDNGIVHEPPVSLFVMGTNTWRQEREWPLARATYAKYYLHSGGRANSSYGDGVLGPTRPQSEPSDEYAYDPLRPVPFITELTSAQIGGPDDYAAIERRDDVLVYTTEPLIDAMEVTGPIAVELYAATDALDTDFMAKLVDVWPTGFAQRITDGMVRLRFREGMERPELAEPGKVYRLEIDCWYTAHVFLPGHRVRLEIASSAFPKYDRNPNTGDPLGETDRTIRARQHIFHDERYPSALILPIIPGDA